MRISKLFHWLYASIMLMPIFAIGVKSLYVTFNPNSKDSYYGETINESEKVSITSVSNLQYNETYYLETQEFLDTTNYGTLNIRISNYYNLRTLQYENVDQILIIYQTNSTSERVFLYYQGAYVSQINLTSSLVYCSFTFLNVVENTLSNDFLQYIKYIEYNDYSYIDNVFYYSVEQISNEGLFNWANNTFLAQPLLFITNLFGVPSTSPIITILCYWFAISVIWLVFDVIMYIPLLVHRWLDKGVIE